MIEAMKAESAANKAAQVVLQNQVDTERASTTTKMEQHDKMLADIVTELTNAGASV